MTWAKVEDLDDIKIALKVLKSKFDKAKTEFGIKELWDHVVFKV